MRTVRTLGALAVATIALGACEPAKYALMPLEEAAWKAPTPLVEQVMAPVEPPPPIPATPVRVGDAYWQVSAPEYRLPNTFVRPVATLDGLTFHSFSWDREPFDRLLAPAPGMRGSWIEFVQVY
ncbi:MAG TPA: hypothetical protein VF158_08010 [Longimicrobiales bacterium]